MNRTPKVIKVGKNGTFPNKAYKNLYHKVDAWLKKVNPCKIKNGQCVRGRSGGRNFCCGAENSNGEGACSYCTSTGCNAKQPLACRLWLCQFAMKELTINQKKQLEDFKKAAGNFGNDVLMFRASKEKAKKIFIENRKLFK